MSLILSGSDGLSDVDGSAATPALRGTDANTGIFFPAADTIAFSEGGVESMRIDSSGFVGIGTTSPTTPLQVNGTITALLLADTLGGSVAPSSSVMRNRIINGAMVIDQRNAGASVTPDGSYTLDRWRTFNTQTSKFTVQQNAASVTPPAGFTNYLGVTSSSAFSVGASDYFSIAQAVEGFNTADLGWGTANAKTVTLSFWVRSSLTGTFGGTIVNSAFNRNYIFSYTILSANTWEQKSVTITGDTSGTWLSNSSAGLWALFTFGAGASRVGTAGSWGGTYIPAPTGQTAVVSTNGATFYITGVQLEVGTQATSFEYRQYQQELALCQRYYQRIQGDTSAQRSVGIGTVGSATAIFRVSVPMKTSMRAAPTLSASGLTGYDGGGGSNVAVSLGTGYQTSEQISFDISGGSGYTAGRAAVILTGSSSTSYFDASAEL